MLTISLLCLFGVYYNIRIKKEQEDYIIHLQIKDKEHITDLCKSEHVPEFNTIKTRGFGYV